MDSKKKHSGSIHENKNEIIVDEQGCKQSNVLKSSQMSKKHGHLIKS